MSKLRPSIICPYCGHGWGPSRALFLEWVKNGIKYPEVCRQCNNIYEIYLHLGVKYHTKPIKPKIPRAEAPK